MSDYVLSCCSTVDLTAEHLASRNLSHICFHFQLDGTSYPDDLGKSVPFETFYRKMTEGAETSTSQINIAEYLDYFEGFLKEGKDVLHITFSSGLSGSYLSARSAADIARERYPERKLFVVDSLAASSGYGLLMDKAADLRDEGLGIEELAKWVEENRLRLHHWFFSTDLTFYIKGGRVSKTSGAIAGVLGICPLLNMDEEGRLTPRMKIRSKKKVKEKIVEQMQLLADDRTDYSGKCYICHSACLDDAKDVAEAVENAFPKLNGKVEINSIGTVIGSHTGPGTVALFFWGDSR
ncbi:MAG: DegV family protein [Oscillospiraceae bacterium]|nr:DegV family protein [Oscillospiraceae bacterium]